MASNTFLFDTLDDHVYQEILHKTATSHLIINKRLEKTLKYGEKVNRHILSFSNMKMRTESRSSERTSDAVVNSKEYLDIDYEKYLMAEIHDNDILQHGPRKTKDVMISESAKIGTEYFDGVILNEVQNANDTLDDGDIGGIDGNPIIPGINNLAKITTVGRSKLRAAKVKERAFIWIIDPSTTAIIEQYLMNKDTNLSDNVFKNNYVGQLVNGMGVYESSSLTQRSKLTVGTTNPSDGDTIATTQAGTTVTWTFRATANSAGEIKIGGTAALTADNVILAMEGTGTGDGTDYYECSTADRAFLDETVRVDCTDGATYVDFQFIGAGEVTVTGTFTDATNNYFGKGWLDSFFGVKGSVDVVMQRGLNFSMTTNHKNPKLHYLHHDLLFGKKTFADGARRFLNCKIETQDTQLS